MTVDGKSIDGWPIHYDYQPKAASVHIEDRIKDTLQGRALSMAIRQSLEDRGIVVSFERFKLIDEACEKEIK